MQTLPADLLHLIVVFQPFFTKPVWEHAKVLLFGALLARGTRMVTACLRAVGLHEEKAFQNYHRVLNRARRSAWQASRILFGLLLALIPAPGAIVIGACAGEKEAAGMQVCIIARRRALRGNSGRRRRNARANAV